MGQKVDPRGIRIGITKTWDSRWFAEGKEYLNNFHEDIKIKEYIKKNYYQQNINQDKLGADQPIMKKYNLSEKESDNIFLNIKTYIIFKSSYMKKERDNKNDIIYNCNIFFTSCTGIIIL